jgi:GNAT superfamily N-acetyltransferase
MRGYCEFYESDPTDEGLEAMARALISIPDEEGYLLVAADAEDEPVVGFAACGWKWSSLRGARVVVLEDLFVTPDARGRGHADALIVECARIAKEHGAPVMTWLTGPDNVRAQTVYNRVGGTPEDMIEYELEL